jgi:hypothetical protein
MIFVEAHIKMVSHIKARTQIEVAREQGAEENIWN